MRLEGKEPYGLRASYAHREGKAAKGDGGRRRRRWAASPRQAFPCHREGVTHDGPPGARHGMLARVVGSHDHWLGWACMRDARGDRRARRAASGVGSVAAVGRRPRAARAAVGAARTGRPRTGAHSPRREAVNEAGCTGAVTMHGFLLTRAQAHTRTQTHTRRRMQDARRQ